VFFEGDVDDILKIPVGCAGAVDYLAWNYTKNGNFSVRSAYHLKMQLMRMREGKPSSSSSTDEHKGWLALWAADVPGKAKIHVWRLIKNGLAVGDELQRRRIKEGVKCIVCSQDESLLHHFWLCPHSVATWEVGREGTGLQLCSPSSLVWRPSELHGWVLDWLGRMDEKELAFSIMLLYQMWLARNEARDQAQIVSPKDLVRRSMALVEEWVALKPTAVHTPPLHTDQWQAPNEGWFKLNSDGAFSMEQGSGGSGVVLRDHHGGFVVGACHFFPSVPDPERVELLACKQALQLAVDKGIDRVVLESDCLGAVVKLNNKEIDRSSHGPLVEEIKLLLSGFTDHYVRHVRRTCNGVAHSLAKVGCVNKVCEVWLDHPPDQIVSTLASEMG
jgi:ribonuclease HI